MKKHSTTLCLIACILLACNTQTNTAATTDTAAVTTSVSDTAKNVAAIEDPDTTDTIPASAYGINTFGKETETLVRNTLQTMFKDVIDKNIIDSFSRRFIFFTYDLSNDNNKEIFVGLTGSYFCGSGGCTFLILNNDGTVNSEFSVSDYPVVINSNTTNGWKDLFIESKGKYHIVKYNGKKYPGNPSVQPLLNTIPGDDLPRALNYLNEPYPWFRF